MSPHDAPPGPAAKLLIAFCMAVIAAVTAASLIGMARSADRAPAPYATDCEMVSELCEEKSNE